MPIRLENLSKHFEREAVLEGIDLIVEDGSFLTILGASGCGKSTLLNLIAGLAAPSSGRIILDGEPVMSPGPDRVMVFQRPGLYPWLNLRDNVAFGLSLRAKSKIDWAEVDRMIHLTGLQGFETRKVYELSGGMQQRVALARALVMHPRVLLMDEPFSALDAQTRMKMQDLLIQIWEKIRATIVFVTHDIDEAITLADRLVVMSTRPGRIALDRAVELVRPRDVDVVAQPEFVTLKRAARAILSA